MPIKIPSLSSFFLSISIFLSSLFTGLVQAQSPAIKEQADFKQYFDAYGVEGSFLLYHEQQRRWTTYNFARNEQGFLPASTFKILNSLIALEEGWVQDSSSVLKWNGQKTWNQNWNQDLSLQKAFAFSCVPCYQELARKTGLQKMQAWVVRAAYGNMQIDAHNLDQFWLNGKSRITPYEQVYFLQRLYHERLPFSPKSLKIVKQLMLREKSGTHRIYAKTGLTMQEQFDIGWYVGYVEAQGEVYFFALNIQKPSKQENSRFIEARLNITQDILRALQIL